LTSMRGLRCDGRRASAPDNAARATTTDLARDVCASAPSRKARGAWEIVGAALQAVPATNATPKRPRSQKTAVAVVAQRMLWKCGHRPLSGKPRMGIADIGRGGCGWSHSISQAALLFAPLLLSKLPFRPPRPRRCMTTCGITTMNVPSDEKVDIAAQTTRSKRD
jgi:hypothetical protein